MKILEFAISRLMRLVEDKMGSADALIVGDYGKGIVSEPLLNWLKERCQADEQLAKVSYE